METVSKALDVGKRMIWGDTSTSTEPTEPTENKTASDEPVSGITGGGTTLDPYDAGNRDDQIGAPSPLEESDPIKTTTAATGEELKLDPNAPSTDPDTAITGSAPVTDAPTVSATNKDEVLNEEGEKLAADLADGVEKQTAASSTGAGTANSDVNSTATGEIDQFKGKRKSKLGKLKQKLHIGKS